MDAGEWFERQFRLTDEGVFNLLFGARHRKEILESDPDLNIHDWVEAGLEWLRESGLLDEIEDKR